MISVEAHSAHGRMGSTLMVMHKVPLRGVCDVKSPGWRKLMERDTKVKRSSSRTHGLFMSEET